MTAAAAADRCPACDAAPMQRFLDLASVPTNSCILLESEHEARSYPRGRIALAFCPACGFVSNLAFDQALAEYSQRYEETQGFSPTFNAFHRRLAESLVERYRLRDKDIVEIGCGKGDFLRLLCELGGNRGVGFDPGYVAGRHGVESPSSVRFVTDLYSDRYRQEKADFVCCKMTLEHIHAARQFTAMIRRAVGDRADTVVFLQVPDAGRILRDCAFEDVYYEHCSYFSPGSLGRLCRAVGFEVLDLASVYQGQYLTIELRPAGDRPGEATAAEHDLDDLRRWVATFPARFAARREQWNDRLADWRRAGRRVVVWGSGSKAVSFLTTVDRPDTVVEVVDVNPFRHGHFMPVTAQPIVAPASLAGRPPDAVIVMNPIYLEEIGADLRRLGLAPEVIAL